MVRSSPVSTAEAVGTESDIGYWLGPHSLSPYSGRGGRRRLGGRGGGAALLLNLRWPIPSKWLKVPKKLR